MRWFAVLLGLVLIFSGPRLGEMLQLYVGVQIDWCILFRHLREPSVG